VFARVCRWEELDDTSRDAGIEWFTEDYLPIAREMPGFEGSLLLVDRPGARVTTITLWSSEEELRASEESVRRIADRNAAAGAPRPTIESFELEHADLGERARS
jgi:heme-degrading monooxygenase HmoA